MSKLNSLKVMCFALISFLFISCGSDKAMVNNIDVSTSVDQSGDILMTLSADLGIGNLKLPNASFPIILPKDGREIGQVSLTNASGGKNLLTIDINVSEASNLELASVRLPNGSMIPLVADNPVLRIPVGKIEVYLSLVDGAQVLGVSVPIKSFDSLGRKVGTTALMPVFSRKGTIGAAGVYTSKTSGKNGIAVVADISGKLTEIPSFSTQFVLPQMQQAELDYSSAIPSRKQKRKLDKGLYKLHKKRTTLRLHK